MSAPREIVTRTARHWLGDDGIVHTVNLPIANFILHLNQPLVPTRLFTGEPEALAWLRGFLS